MKKHILLFLLFSFIVTLLPAQTRISFEHAIKYDPNLYDDHEGSPYFFSTFTSGWVIGMDGVKYDEVQLNFNGLTESIEVLEGDYFINLKESLYLMVNVLDPETQDTVKFIRALYKRFQGKYLQLLYRSPQSILFNQFKVNLIESETSTVGGERTNKRLKHQNNYYVKHIDKSEPILLNNKKSWIRAFGNKKKIESFLKKNQLDLSKTSDVVQLLQYIE